MTAPSDCITSLLSDGFAYCRHCDALQQFTWVGTGTEDEWDCFMCGETHVSEGFSWHCTACAYRGDPIARLNKELKRGWDRRRAG